MIYQTFARLYDGLFDDDMYQAWADFVQTIVPQPTAILDVAGGAGRLAVLLAQRGYEMTGLDLSPEMLSLAVEHREAAQVDLMLVEGNMLALGDLPKYPVITCFADSLCYLDNFAEFQQALSEIYAHLEEGGHFIFDMMSPYQMDQVYPGYMFNYQDEDHQRAFMWQSFADDDVDHGVIHDLTFFVQSNNGQYDRISEMHFQRSYPREWVLKTLEKLGYQKIQVRADFGKAAVDEHTTRWFFICQK